jgi:hypothetical protein
MKIFGKKQVESLGQYIMQTFVILHGHLVSTIGWACKKDYEKDDYRIFAGKLLQIGPLGGPRKRWKDNNYYDG